MTFKNSHLVLQGNAPLTWERTVLAKLASLNFVRSYNIKNLLIDEELRFQELVTKLEELSIYFPNEKAVPKNTETDYFQYMTKIIRKLQQLSGQLNKPIELVVTGYTDSSGTTRFNQSLAEKRSEYIIGQLRQQGVSIGLKKAISTSGNKNTPDDSERKISLKVIFSGIKKP
jgi:outer membrane protein OmpA-like peptidoglycan-associated protein